MNLPLGFRAAAVAAGLKSGGGLDLTLIENQGPNFFAAAVFTSNQVIAAPVIWSKEVIKGEIARAVILNSGGANACTGPQGFQDVHATAERVGKKLGISSGEVLVCSTGLIGELLPMPKIFAGIDEIFPKMNSQSLEDCARAIMTTDSVPKIAKESEFGIEIVGIAKGAGMLAPALATMLCVVMTDAILPTNTQGIFKDVVDRTFNRIDSDGCTSTNDTVLLMASGASGQKLNEDQCQDLLAKVCASLSAQLIADAEGATKSISIIVTGASNEADALSVARACARNSLLKCAIFGGDPNWGRVLAAVGTSTAYMEPFNIDVWLNGIQVAKASAPFAKKSLVDFTNREVEILINLNVGDAKATVITNDLSHAYVHENSAYAT